MPHIKTAMQGSVRKGVTDIVFDSLLRRQSVGDRVSNVKSTFSSWDNCMAQSYCKWPVIAGIVVISLMVFSILWCCVRCCCCGMSCCCSCFSFLKCCDCCGGACDGKKNKPMKHLDDPYAHHGAPMGGYHAPAPMPMMGGGLGKPEPPQYAQFEVGKSGLAVDPKSLNEDALPPMPSWDSAAKKHVMTEEEKNSVELGELDPMTGQKIPLMAGAVAPGNSMPASPVHEMGASPFGARPGQGVANEYVGVAAGDPYAQNNNSFNGNGVYRGSPGPVPGRGFSSPPPQDSYAYNNFTGPSGSAFDRGPPERENTGDRNRQFSPQPSRQYSGNSSRPLDRQYSDRSQQPNNFNQPPRGPSRGPQNDGFSVQPPRGPSRGPPNRMASPAINNNFGFDFGTGGHQVHSRPAPTPQQSSYNSDRRPSPPLNGNDGYYEGSAVPPTYASRSPPPQEQSYSGYQAYQPAEPASNHHRAPTALRPGAGRDRREPQGWDPVNH